MTKKIICMMAVTAVLLASAAVCQEAKKDDKPIVPKEKIVLFNGKDLSGWEAVFRQPREANLTWSAREGVIRCEGQDDAYGYLQTEKEYADYLVHVEWRWPEKAGNSGVLVHKVGPNRVWPKCFECQLYADNAGDFLVIGEGDKYDKNISTAEWKAAGHRVNGRRIAKLHESSEKGVGEWNSYDIICKDDWIVMLVNGVVQNVATEASITGGKICLQSEGAPVEFRNIYIEPVQ
jgi:hypothetical protein